MDVIDRDMSTSPPDNEVLSEGYQLGLPPHMRQVCRISIQANDIIL